jgi:hypothetical protein
MYDLKVARKMTQIASSASSRGIECNMSFKRTKQLIMQKRCYYTKVAFDEANERSFDRLDNTKGYTDDNVVACTVRINTKKQELTLLEIEQLYKGIKHLL